MSTPLSDEERARLREQIALLHEHRNRLAAEIEQIADVLDADDLERGRSPGTLHEFRPRPATPTEGNDPS